MKKYIALGDSLTAQQGYIDFLNQQYNLDILNLAVGGGSNYLVFHRLRNCLFSGQVGADTTLIWQISGLQRHHEVRDKNSVDKLCHGQPFMGLFDWFPVTLDLFNKDKVALLNHNDYFRSRDLPDFENSIQDLAGEIFLWSHVVKRIVLFAGWTSSIDTVSMKRLSHFLDQQSNIDVLDSANSIVDWCRDKKLSFKDSGHPTESSYIQWCQEILIPVLDLK